MISQNKFDLKESKKRTGIIGVLILFFIVGIVARLFWLQIIRGTALAKEAKEQIAGENIELSPRGSILDRNGEDLAVSIISKSLYVNPQEMDDDPDKWARGKQPNRNPREVAADLLAPILNIKREELLQEFNDRDRCFIWVQRTMEPNVAVEVIRVLKENNISGFHFQDESKRYYTKNNLASQILGFVGTDDKGLEGVEASLTN